MDRFPRLWLVVLLGAWLMAIGGHDLVMDEHHHDSSPPEIAIVQAWHCDLALSWDGPQMVAAPVLVVLILVCAVIQCETLQLAPQYRLGRPRPPNLTRILFRGPPAQRCPQRLGNRRDGCVQNLSCAGVAGLGLFAPGCRTL